MDLRDLMGLGELNALLGNTAMNGLRQQLEAASSAATRIWGELDAFGAAISLGCDALGAVAGIQAEGLLDDAAIAVRGQMEVILPALDAWREAGVLESVASTIEPIINAREAWADMSLKAIMANSDCERRLGEGLVAAQILDHAHAAHLCLREVGQLASLASVREVLQATDPLAGLMGQQWSGVDALASLAASGIEPAETDYSWAARPAAPVIDRVAFPALGSIAAVGWVETTLGRQELTLGKLCLGQKMWAEAEYHYSRAAEWGEADAEVHLGRGVALNALGRFQDSVEAFEMAEDAGAGLATRPSERRVYEASLRRRRSEGVLEDGDLPGN